MLFTMSSSCRCLPLPYEACPFHPEDSDTLVGAPSLPLCSLRGSTDDEEAAPPEADEPPPQEFPPADAQDADPVAEEEEPVALPLCPLCRDLSDERPALLSDARPDASERSSLPSASPSPSSEALRSSEASLPPSEPDPSRPPSDPEPSRPTSDPDPSRPPSDPDPSRPPSDPLRASDPGSRPSRPPSWLPWSSLDLASLSRASSAAAVSC